MIYPYLLFEDLSILLRTGKFSNENWQLKKQNVQFQLQFRMYQRGKTTNTLFEASKLQLQGTKARFDFYWTSCISLVFLPLHFYVTTFNITMNNLAYVLKLGIVCEFIWPHVLISSSRIFKISCDVNLNKLCHVYINSMKFLINHLNVYLKILIYYRLQSRVFWRFVRHSLCPWILWQVLWWDLSSDLLCGRMWFSLRM